MKIFLICLAISLSSFFPAISWAGEYNANIHLIRTNSDLDQKISWFQLDGVTVPGCAGGAIFGGPNLTFLAIKGDETQMLSTLLSAYATNAPIHVLVETGSAHLISGLCRATSLTLIRN
jgi:hypothetical protein